MVWFELICGVVIVWVWCDVVRWCMYQSIYPPSIYSFFSSFIHLFIHLSFLTHPSIHPPPTFQPSIFHPAIPPIIHPPPIPTYLINHHLSSSTIQHPITYHSSPPETIPSSSSHPLLIQPIHTHPAQCPKGTAWP